MRRIDEVALPREWSTCEPLFIEPIMEGRDERDGSPVWAAGGMLDDGTNVIVLKWSRGACFARMGPDTGWAIEEKVAPRMPKHIRKVWSVLVESIVRGKRDTEAGVPLSDEDKVQIAIRHPAMLREAHRAYCERTGQDVPFEQFEMAVQAMKR